MTAEEKPPREPRRRWPWQWRLRLRHKLAVTLALAAILPVVVAATVAVRVVLRGLDSGLHDETTRQLQVGLNLVLRNVERLGQDAVRLASSAELSAAMVFSAHAVNDALAKEDPNLPSSLVQIADDNGVVIAERVVGGATPRFAGLRVPDNAVLIQAGLAYERRVTLEAVGGVVVVRAVAPIVDPSYELQGVVVVSLPLDGDFADGVKGALGSDVLLFAGGGAAMSTFVDDYGARRIGIEMPPPVLDRVRGGQTVLTEGTIAGHAYALGYTPLVDLGHRVVGIFAVAVERAPLLDAKVAATRSLGLGAAAAFLFALALAALLSRRLTRPIARLHQGALAIARGDLDQRIHVDERDEIGDLAEAFTNMTAALKENQERLAARMRELVALHDASRAVSSVISLEQVLRRIVDAAARVLEARLCALWLVEPGGGGGPPALRLGAARAKPADGRLTVAGDQAAELAAPLSSIAAEVAAARATLRIDRVAQDEPRREAAVAAGVTGSLVATPLERKGSVVGVIAIGRSREARPFSEADSNLLATFADQAAAAVENARLYEEVRAFNEELEQKVRLRTSELQAMNHELGRALAELRDTQGQLILSERLAGLGMLVAGVAHDINSPSAAIRGSVDALAANVHRLAEHAAELAELPVSVETRDAVLRLVATATPVVAARRVGAPVAVRRTARQLTATLEAAGVPASAAVDAARALADMGADDLVDRLAGPLAEAARAAGTAGAATVIGYLTEAVFLERSALSIQRSIYRIQRIVGALKSYSHLDQQAARVDADLHEGIENTLVILDHEVSRGITVTRSYGSLPPVPVYVDELNQVWTNLIHNAVQALKGEGHITIETEPRGDGVAVRIIDDGPGIDADVMPRIFDPFFTTKPKGEGTGLGLRIVRNIVDKHGGRVTCDSRPGRTCFEVWLPVARAAAVSGAPAPGPSGDDGTVAA